MKTFKLFFGIVIVAICFACSSPGEKAAKEMCSCISSLGVPEDQLSSITDVQKINELKSCVNNVTDKYKDEMDEDEQKKARIVLRETCPEASRLMGI